MKKNIVILGAGGHAKVIAEIIIKSGDEVVGFLDDSIDLQGKEIYLGKKVIGTFNSIEGLKENYFVIGVGDNNTRKRISLEHDLKWYSAIHPSAIIATNVKIGEGTVVMPGAVLNPSTKIGKQCIINTMASVDHDCNIGNYVHISPGAHLAGTVTVMNNTWIGIGALIKNNITIEENNIIGSGAVVIDNILEKNSTFIGIPARKMR